MSSAPSFSGTCVLSYPVVLFEDAASSILDCPVSRPVQNKPVLPKLPSLWHPVIAAQDGRPTPMAMLRISISVVLSDSHLEVSTRDVKWYFLHVLSHMLCSGLLFVIMKYPFLAHTHTPVILLSPFTASGPPLPRLCPDTQWPCASLSMSPGIPTYTNVKIRC